MVIRGQVSVQWGPHLGQLLLHTLGSYFYMDITQITNIPEKLSVDGDNTFWFHHTFLNSKSLVLELRDYSLVKAWSQFAATSNISPWGKSSPSTSGKQGSRWEMPAGNLLYINMHVVNNVTFNLHCHFHACTRELYCLEHGIHPDGTIPEVRSWIS